MEKERTIVQQFGDFACSLNLEKIPSEVKQKIKLCIMDALECCISSESDIRKKGAFNSIEKRDSEKGCLLWGTCSYASPENAAFYNGVSGAISSRNDINRKAKAHPGSVIVPTVLGIAEHCHANGRQVMKAILAGYEVMTRYGNTLRLAKLPSSFRGTAMTGSTAAALSAAVVLRLPSEQVSSAASFAVHNSFGLNQWAWAGTGEDVLQNGWCCRNGIQAAFLAQAGVPGTPDIFEGPCGMLEAFRCLPLAEYMTDDLGKAWHILDIRFKEISACINVQSPGQAAQILARKHQINTEDIQSVEIQISGRSKSWPGCDNVHVSNLVQAIMSIQFTVAQALVHKDCSAIKWAPPYDDAVKSLIPKCILVENEQFTKIHDQQQSVIVTVTMKDKTTYSQYLEDVITLTDQQVMERFHDTIERYFGLEKANKLENMIQNLENIEDTSFLVSLLKADA